MQASGPCSGFAVYFCPLSGTGHGCLIGNAILYPGWEEFPSVEQREGELVYLKLDMDGADGKALSSQGILAGTGVAVVPDGTAPALKQPYLPGQYSEYPAAVQGWAQQALPGGGSGIEGGSVPDFYVGPNGKELPSQYKDWIGTNIQKELLEQAENLQLQNAIKQLYRGNSLIGDGGTADVIRFEQQTGLMLGKNGGSHVQKGIDMAKYIENKILT